MDAFFGWILFFLGFAIGGLLNAAVFSLEKEESDPASRLRRSFDVCRLRLRDQLSVFSLSKRRQAHLAGASFEELFVEISAGMAFLSAYAHVFPSGFVPEDIFRFILLSSIFFALIVIFVFDFRYFIIPDKVVFPAIGASFLLLILQVSRAEDQVLFVSDYLGAAIFAGGFFLFLIWITRGRGMGGGDVKLGFLMGMVLGISQTLLALFLAFFTGAIAGVALMMAKRKGMKSEMPFGPFLILGFMISFFLGDGIIEWYWGTLSL